MNDIKLCIFDVDGVLVNTRELHYPATAAALAEYGCGYSRQEDEDFGTIPTRQKLNHLVESGRINIEDVDNIWDLKDDYACVYFEDAIKLNVNIKSLFEELRYRDIYVALASNARYSFLEKVVSALDINHLVNDIVSAQGMIPKPNPYMYIKEMYTFGVGPESTLIFEDSEVGRQAAYASGAWVYEVKSFDELSTDILNETHSSQGQFRWSESIHRESPRSNYPVYRKWR